MTELTTQFAGEIIGLIDQYATRVNSKIKQEVSIFWRSLFRRSSAFFKVNKKIRSLNRRSRTFARSNTNFRSL